MRAKSTIQQKQATLAQYLKIYSAYNSIAVYDINGDHWVNDTGKIASNHKDKIYFQEAVRTGKPFIGQPRFSSSSGIFAVYVAAPIRDTKSQQIVGVIRARIPVENIQNIVSADLSYDAYLLDAKGQVFSTSNAEDLEQLKTAGKEKTALPTFFDFQAELQRELERKVNDRNSSAISTEETAQNGQSKFKGKEEVAYLTNISDVDNSYIADISNLGWSILVSIDNDLAFAAQKQLLQVFVLGTIIMGLIAALLF